MELPSLNAWLKISEHIRMYDELPPYAELQLYINEARLTWQRSYLEHLQKGDIAKGLITDRTYNERLGIGAAEVDLLRQPDDAAPRGPKTFASAWINSVRWTFLKGQFYSFPGLKPNLFLYVVDNKSLTGREPRAGDDTAGRPLAATWFERRFDLGADIVHRVDRTSESLNICMCTIAELLATAGGALPPLDLAPRERELQLETGYADEDRLIWEHEHL